MRRPTTQAVNSFACALLRESFYVVLVVMLALQLVSLITPDSRPTYLLLSLSMTLQLPVCAV